MTEKDFYRYKRESGKDKTNGILTKDVLAGKEFPNVCLREVFFMLKCSQV